MSKLGIGKCCSPAESYVLPWCRKETQGSRFFSLRLPYGGVCCLVTVTVILSINKNLYDTAVFSLLLINTEVLLTHEFPLRHSSPSFTSLPPILPSRLFPVPQFQREAGNKSWKLICHPLFSSSYFLPLHTFGNWCCLHA